MPALPPLQFGEVPEGVPVVQRPGAYAVVLDHGADPPGVLLVEWRGRYFLPGGGMHDGETPRQALVRELREETGHEIAAAELIGEAGQFLSGTKAGQALDKRCTFFRVRLGQRAHEPGELDHRLVWVPVRDAVGMLHEEASAWAVRQVT